MSALLVLVGSAGSAVAGDTMAIGPVELQMQISGVPVTLPATAHLMVSTAAERVSAQVDLSVGLDDVERKASAIARAAGLGAKPCENGRPLQVRIDGAELVSAPPALIVKLRGKVRGWVCRPIPIGVTPELDAVAQTTLSVVVDGKTLGLIASDTSIAVPEIGRLGSLQSAAKELLAGAAAKAQDDLRKELSKHAVHLDQVIAPAEVTALQGRFDGKALLAAASARLEAGAAAVLARTLVDGARRR